MRGELLATLTGRTPNTERVRDQGVTSSVLMKHFEELVHATGSAKLLKQLVLHLAMEGRLSDGPAESVEPLRAEVRPARDRLAKSGVRVRSLPPIEHAELPWTLPAGWAWVRLGELGGFLGGGTPSKSNSSFWAGPLPWVSPKDMKQPYIDDTEDHISMAAVEESAAKLIPTGSILCVVRGMILAHSFPVALTRREVAINQDMKALVLAVPALGEFVLRACQDARARVLANVERSSHGTCRLDGEVVENLLIPLPPLAEQKRIVAKVDHLMALCDDLEARQTKKRELSNRLTKSALQALTTAESPEDFDLAWKRVVENFDVLIDRAEKVRELRKAIRDVALRGVLGRAQRPLRSTPDGPYALPEDWAWLALSDVGGLINGDRSKNYPSKEHRVAQGIPFVNAGHLRGGRVDYTEMDYISQQRFDLLRGGKIRAGDLLYCLRGSLGKVGIVETEPGAIASSLCIVRPETNRVLAAFLLLYFDSSLGERMIRKYDNGTAQPNLSATDLGRYLVPVPSLGEQREVLLKVEQLMKVCDDLESRLARAEDRASKLVEAVAHDLVA